MAKGDKGKKSDKRSDAPREAVTSDARFKSVHNDPRFRLPSMKKFKVKVDERFSKLELKKLNASSTGKKVKIDRYGRKLTEEDSNLDRFYEHESDEEDEEDNDDEDDEEPVVDEEQKDVEAEESEESEESEVDEATATLDRARGEGIASDSDSDSESESSESESEPEVDDDDSEAEIEGGEVKDGEPTRAFAVVNLDWDNLRAVDLMATLISFVPTSGLIRSVTIYPSEFGKQQMQKEEIEGPPKELFKSKKQKKKEEEDSDSDSDLDLTNKDDLAKAARKLFEEDNGEEDYDSKALRRYQLQRLRYYYAVVQCDSIQTAREVYEKCDGTEYESTSNIFDLRYIPDEMDFDESEARDSCTKVPTTYRPSADFVTDALQHSKVKLTWDETPKERLQLSSRQFTQREIDDMDFKAYLASDSEGSDAETNNDLKDKYKSLLGGSFGKKNQQEEEEEIDMEITFNPGLDENSAAGVEAKEPQQEESTIAAYKRKEKERRQRRMEKFKESQQNDEDDEQVKSKDKKKKGKKSKQPVDEKSKAELELILMNEDDDKVEAEHFNMRDVIKSEKLKGKKRKNKKIDSEMTQDTFEADLNDPRFSEIFESHEYAIDPTNTDFKKTETMKQILQERSKRKKSGSSRDHKKQKTDSTGTDLSSLVQKVKNKNNK